MWISVLIFLNLIIISKTQFDFEPPCTCEESYCECCIDASLISQEGCIRVTLQNNSIRISFVLNGDELGGFSTNLNDFNLPNLGISLSIPCLPNSNLALRLRNRTVNSRRHFCLNAFIRGPVRIRYDQDFCFDINGNRLSRSRSRSQKISRSRAKTGKIRI